MSHLDQKTKNPSRILDAIYETASDLHKSGVFNEEQLQKYQQLCPSSKPVYLDADIVQYLNEKCQNNAENLQILVNDLLRKDIEIAQRVAS